VVPPGRGAGLRQLGGDQTAEADDQHHDRRRETDRLAGQILGVRPGQFAQRAAVLDLHPGGAQRRDGGVDLRQVVGAE
jgi:hypothetical protein